MYMTKPLKINVLGLGNVIYGDEGFGVEAVRLLEKTADFPENVHLIDGGTQGVYLLDYLESTDRLLIFDAIIPQDHEFKVYTYQREDLPAFIHRKMSSHQMGLSELISLAKLHGKEPEKMVLIGVPPKQLDMQVGLSPEVSALLPKAVAEGQSVLKDWISSGKK